MKKALLYLVFIILACSPAFAITVSDLKPDDKVRDLEILAPSPFYKEEDSSAFVMQPFESYDDVEANIFIYDSPRGNAPKGYDLMVAFEEWRTEAQAEERFEKGFRKYWDCTIEFEGRRIKECEHPAMSPQLVYAFYYKNLFIRVQPHPDYPNLNQDLFYLSFDMKKLRGNIISKILKLEEEAPVKEKISFPEKKITPEQPIPTEEQEISEETKPGFFSRNKYYILGSIGLLLILFWMYKTRKFLGVIFVIILCLIIFNRSTVFTREEIISLVILWVIIYFLVSRFYRKKIKKEKKNSNQKRKKDRNV